ncbi:MAG TPA: hypothetical protein PLD47_13140 [Aggregatilineales bacterium]|nr:hypothetical protein [Anaerolineales bacterium]HRE48663.1 hypothetical protein [Aggregatilineales bacterium]
MNFPGGGYSNEDDEYDDSLDDEFALSRDQNRDDFASFDANRYVERRGRLADADPEDVMYDARRQAEDGSQPLGADFDPSAYIRRRTSVARPAQPRGRQSRRGAQDARLQPQMESSDTEAGTGLGSLFRFGRRGGGGQSPLGLLGMVTTLTPGIGIVALSFGCFGLMALIGACGLMAHLLGIIKP